MSIGLYDADMAFYLQTPLNLELMKYSTYYKKKMEIVAASPSFEPNKYTTFIMRKDYQDNEFFQHFKNYDNIIYGGHAFSGSKYIPLDESIELCHPDTSIYNKFQGNFNTSNKMQAAFEVMSKAEHLRLSLDGKTIWPKFEKQLQINPRTSTLFFHDYNLNEIENSHEVVKELLTRIERSAASGFLAMKYPVIIDSLDDLIFWSSFRSTSSFYNVEINGPLSDEELYTYITMGNLRTAPSKIEYNLTTKFKDEDDFVMNGLLQIYNQVLFLRMNKTRFLLKYEDDFFVDKRWERVIKLMNSFMSVTTRLGIQQFKYLIEKDTMFKFVRSFSENNIYKEYDMFTKSEARSIFSFVKEKNYEVFKAFYEANKVELKGGHFKNDTE